jgi:hypothetical protein
MLSSESILPENYPGNRRTASNPSIIKKILVRTRNKLRFDGLGTLQMATCVNGNNLRVILMKMSKEHKMERAPAWLKLAGIVLVTFGFCLPGFAALGGDLSSVHADQANMKASLRTTAGQVYTLHEIKTAMGTTVREFVSADGRVFAVAWHGPSMPPMQQILGTYFQQFSAGAQAHHAAHIGRRPLNIQAPGLVVQSTGHPRGFFGRAYVPAMLPAGVSANDIR